MTLLFRTTTTTLALWLLLSAQSLLPTLSFAPPRPHVVSPPSSSRRWSVVEYSPPEERTSNDATSSEGLLQKLFWKTDVPKKDDKVVVVVQQIMTMPEYKQVVVDEPDQLVVVRFFAPWCRACKAVAPAFRQLASHYASLSEEVDNGLMRVKFVELPLTKENAFLHQGLGVPSMPYAHIYHPDVGLVEEMKMNKKTFADFSAVVETYVKGSCDIPPELEQDSA